MNTTRRERWLRAVLPLALGAGCTIGQMAPEKRATAQIESKSGSTITGTATFVPSGTSVALELVVTGASPGQHGVHLHATGDCSDPNGASAGGHWNPGMANHGLPAAAMHHLGDCGNFEVGADGSGKLTFMGSWSIGTGDMTDIVGKAIIIHASVDDGVSQQPTPGNAGARQACGVIVAQ